MPMYPGSDVPHYDGVVPDCLRKTYMEEPQDGKPETLLRDLEVLKIDLISRVKNRSSDFGTKIRQNLNMYVPGVGADWWHPGVANFSAPRVLSDWWNRTWNGVRRLFQGAYETTRKVCGSRGVFGGLSVLRLRDYLRTGPGVQKSPETREPV